MKIILSGKIISFRGSCLPPEVEGVVFALSRLSSNWLLSSIGLEIAVRRLVVSWIPFCREASVNKIQYFYFHFS